MGTSRQSFDLTNKWGRKNFWSYFKKDIFDLWAWYYVWGDTFGLFVCLLSGHKPFEDDEGVTYCSRCHKHLTKGLQK